MEIAEKTIEQAAPRVRVRAWLLPALILVSALIVYSRFQPYDQPSTGDSALYDYFAQLITRGGVPYRDVVDIKTPLSTYIGAASIVALEPFGVRDVIAIRFVFIALAAMTVLFTFIVARSYLENARLAVMSAAVLMAFDSFGKTNCSGVQPKTPMILLGLISLWAIIKDRPFLAGLAGMLSALCWQPGLLFVGAAGLAFSRYLTNWRDGKMLKLLAGAALPLVAMILYFAAQGALRDFYLWTFHHNYSVYAPHELRTLAGFFKRLGRVLENSYSTERIFFYLSIVGFLLVAAREFLKRRSLESAPRHALLIAPTVYFLFCAINLQAGPDLIPLLPFAAIFSSAVFVYWLEHTGGAMRRESSKGRAIFEHAAFAVFLGAILILKVADAFFYIAESPTLAEQDAQVAEVMRQIEPGDEIYVHGQIESLVLSGMTNADKYVLLGRGKDVYLDYVEQGGFDGWLERLKMRRPKVVALTRLAPVSRREEIENWVREDYTVRQGQLFNFYVRK
ncbi:MAG: DolP-mannose mannosyltransferase [Acidobacteriota bacterium]